MASEERHSSMPSEERPPTPDAGSQQDPVFELMGWVGEPMLLKRLPLYIAEGIAEVATLLMAMHFAELQLRPHGLFLRLLLLPLSVVGLKAVWALRLAWAYLRVRRVHVARAIRLMGYAHSRDFWTCSAAMFTCLSCVLMVWHGILFLLMTGYDYRPHEAFTVRFLQGASGSMVVTNWAFWRDFVRNYRDSIEEEGDLTGVQQLLRMYKSEAFRLCRHEDLPAGGRDDNALCVVCLEAFSQKEEVSQLPCGHVFHPTCAHKWLLEDWRCPFRCSLAVAPSPKVVGLGVDRLGEGPVRDLELGGTVGFW